MPVKIRLLAVEPSLKPQYKMVARLMLVEPDGRQFEKSIHFGARGYEDFTTHKDEARKQKYIARHAKNEDWEDPLTRGFWSRWILWNLPTIRGSVADVRKRFGFKK